MPRIRKPKKPTNRIFALRDARGWSQRELAEKVGTSSQQISKLEIGKGGLTDEWMYKIAKALGVHPVDLLLEAVGSADEPLPISEPMLDRRKMKEALVWLLPMLHSKLSDLTPDTQADLVLTVHDLLVAAGDGSSPDVDIGPANLLTLVTRDEGK